MTYVFLLIAALITPNPMTVSWYHPSLHGNPTASGEIYDQYEYTAAHKTLPFDSLVLVKHNEEMVIVRINDRGPFVEGRDLDLSLVAAKEIDCIDKGVCEVEAIVLN